MAPLAVGLVAGASWWDLNACTLPSAPSSPASSALGVGSAPFPTSTPTLRARGRSAQAALDAALQCQAALRAECEGFLASAWALRRAAVGARTLVSAVKATARRLGSVRAELAGASNPTLGVLGTAACVDSSFAMACEMLWEGVRRGEGEGEAAVAAVRAFLMSVAEGARAAGAGRVALVAGAGARVSLASTTSSPAPELAAVPGALSLPMPLHLTAALEALAAHAGRTRGLEQELVAHARRAWEGREAGALPLIASHAWGSHLTQGWESAHAAQLLPPSAPHPPQALHVLPQELRPPWNPRDGVPSLMRRDSPTAGWLGSSAPFKAAGSPGGALAGAALPGSQSPR